MPAVASNVNKALKPEANSSRLLRFTGHSHFRQRLILSILSGRPVRIDAIRPEDQEPGIRDFEAGFLRLLEKVTNGSHVEISYTGTSVLLRPGVIAGGTVNHDCGTSRSIGYFLEWITILAPFAKKELTLNLKGITTAEGDLGVDTLRTVTLPHLSLFLPLNTLSTLSSSLELRILKRGAAPLGGGEILFRSPILAHLATINFVEPGRIRKIRGIASSVRVSPQMSNRMVDRARGILGRYIPDLYLFADVYRGEDSGKSPGFALSLVSTSTTGAIHSSEYVSRPSDPTKGLEALTPEDVATKACHQLLEEISTKGCVDRSHQPLVLTLMALGPQDVAKCRMGSLTPNAIQCLRDIKEALGVSFKITRVTEAREEEEQGEEEDDESITELKKREEVILSCVGINQRGFKKVG
ncbi:18S rRNA biogenesis protein [Violaceomyces palustris]|uniref:18S rRNA biogenesis protein n=1 Tax=Violaceomyces palustris TaxID=1673888 RepID=A0ACD0NPU9_9BASI|nr:18S rRNA biogenesis protein [Violaceomyces palustris]